MSETDPTCWFCNDDMRTDPPPGGFLIDDGTWRAGHAPASYAPLGTVVLEARRHVLDQADFNDVESQTCARVTGRLVEAVRRATGCDRVYQWATMDAFPHFHLWLVPWSLSDDLRGPRFLADRLLHGDGCSPAEAEATARALRGALSAPAAGEHQPGDAVAVRPTYSGG
jgi:diadenosine tetraphosphate (Ap4A) HIT family hydrolase